MTKKELNRYFWLQHEIKEQYKRLKKLEAKQKNELVGDTVKDYHSGKGIPILIEGLPEEEWKAPALITALKEDIKKNIEESEKEVAKIEKYVQGIEDPQLREIFRARFLDCLQWEEVGEKNFIAADYARRLVREHFKRNK